MPTYEVIERKIKGLSIPTKLSDIAISVVDNEILNFKTVCKHMTSGYECNLNHKSCMYSNKHNCIVCKRVQLVWKYMNSYIKKGGSNGKFRK